MDMNCIKCNITLTEANHPEYAARNYVYKCIYCLRLEKSNFAKGLSLDIKSNRSKKHRDKLREANPKLYSARQMYSSSQKRAKKFKLDFDITSDYLYSLCVDNCIILNTKIKYGGGDVNKFSASLDRINPKLGYVKGNVRIISNLSNMMKSSATEEELVKFSTYIINNISI